MALITSILLSFGFAFLYAGIIYWFDRYEKEPKLLLGVVFLWGAIVAAGGAYILNTIFGIGVYVLTADELLSEISTGILSAPIVEESLKGLAVLIVYLVFRKEFDSVLDGIVYAGIVALGFAATENVLYLYELGFVEDGWEGLIFLFFLRVIFGAWSHAFYTAFIGIGLAIARLNHNILIKIAAPLTGWLIAIGVHALHNTIASFISGPGGLISLFFIDWAGWLLMAIIILWAVRQVRNRLKEQLKEEIDLGNLTQAQYEIATSSWRTSLARMQAVSSGKFKPTRQFYRLCSELAHKKYQLARLGDENGNTAFVDKLRKELKTLTHAV